jgi:hypothetical protein
MKKPVEFVRVPVRLGDLPDCARVLLSPHRAAEPGDNNHTGSCGCLARLVHCAYHKWIESPDVLPSADTCGNQMIIFMKGQIYFNTIGLLVPGIGFERGMAKWELSSTTFLLVT